jgi:peptidoglycan/xylan/chitin deacetylase (PgdA/CDA1 family)
MSALSRANARPLAALAALLTACAMVLAGIQTASANGRKTSVLGAPTSPQSSGAPAALSSLPPSLQGKLWFHLPTHKKVIALTFDGGGNNAGAPSILDTLSAKHAVGTFFLTGRFTQLYPQTAKRIAKLYPIGNHSYTHPDMTKLTLAQAKYQVTHAQKIIYTTTGQNPKPMFRFPYGATNQSLIHMINSLGYGGISWTVDSLGWEGTSGGQTVAKVVARVVAAAKPGCIVLMHLGSNPYDGTTLDAHALPTIIAKLRAKGYSFVTIRDYLP